MLGLHGGAGYRAIPYGLAHCPELVFGLRVVSLASPRLMLSESESNIWSCGVAEEDS